MEVVRDEYPDFMDEITYRHIQDALDGFDAELKKCTITALNKRGFFFSSDAEFMEFARTRLTNATVEDLPFHNIVYLDFVDFSDLGTYLFSYRNELKTSFDGDKIVTTIG